VPILTVVGAGMIGCSFARAARSAALFEAVLGVEPDAGHAARALTLGSVDAIVETPPAGSAVLLACPAVEVVTWVRRLADHDGVVFDVASVKGAVVERLRAAGGVPANFVPCHPIAGRETSGPDAADEGLFAGRSVIVTPVAETDREHQAHVARWWRALGARLKFMDALEHDLVYARTSHLPHLLAFAYLLGIEGGDLEHSGGGFRDFSRIGASDPDMWTSIFELNADAVLTALGQFSLNLERLADAIRVGDAPACRRYLDLARSHRAGLVDDGADTASDDGPEGEGDG